MIEKEHINNLLTGFLSGTLTPKGKNDLYHYVIDDNHRDEIMAWLQLQWENEPQLAGDIPGDAMFSKIKMEIENQSAIGANRRQRESTPPAKQVVIRQSKIKNQKLMIFLRYAAVFVVAFGLSWAIQKKEKGTSDTLVIAEEPTQYNEILVPYGSKTKVILPDSSAVWLNAGARLKYPVRFNGEIREVYLQGEGFFDVTKDAKRPFVVNSNGVNIRVLGTKFNLMANADDNIIETTLVEGAIEVLGLKDANSNAQKNLVLKPGQKLTLQKEKGNYQIQNIQEAGLSIPEEAATPTKIKSANLSEKADVELSTAWTENRLIFVRERFEDVKIRLERWYGVSIEVRNPEILDYRFTGTFEKQTFEQAMTAFSKAASCNFRIDKNKVLVTSK